ncbi:MAG TPA: hypothetical protein VHM30_07790, partial [Gemmatimonadaceae bacterium]|nr:hypothetical protein [Gemmatimonadaceae bacterium]
WLPLLLLLVMVSAVGVVARRALREARSEGDRDTVAAALERERGLRRGSLVAGLQLAGSGALVTTGLAALEGRLEAPPPRRELRRRGARRVADAFGFAALGAVALAATAPGRSDGVRAVLRPLGAWRGDLLPPLSLEGVPEAVRRGTNFTATVAAPGRSHATLRERQTGSGWRERRVSLDGEGRAPVVVGPVKGDLTLSIADARGSSREWQVRAVDRAYVTAGAMRVTAPSYLGGASERVEAGAPLRVPRGSTVFVEAQATVPLGAIALAAERDTAMGTVRSHRAVTRIRADRDGRWEWHARSTTGEILEVPEPLEVSVIPDSAPTIAIAAPLADTLVASGGSATLRLLASDDHGLAEVKLIVTREGAAPMTREVARGLPARWGADVALDLATLGVAPGRSAQLVAIATDNSPWAQLGRSRPLIVRVPGLAEQRELARAAADSLVRAATGAAASERELAKRTAEASRDRGERPAAGKTGSAANAIAEGQRRDALPYETEQRARSVREEQERLSRNVDAMRQRAGELQKQLDRAGALDSTLAAQLADAQRLLQEALTPELAASLASLDSALKERNADAARSSLADLAREQQRLKEQLDRIAEMLARAAVEGSLQTLHDEAKEIAAAQRAMADSGKRNEGGEAKRLEDRARNVGRDAAAMAERLRKAGGETSSRDASQAAANAQASADAMREEGPAEASKEMDKAADALARAREEQVGAWKSELAGELDRSIQEMLQMAQGERSLEERSRAGASGSALRSEQSALQQGVDKTSERLEKAARASSLLSGRSRRAVAEARRQSSQATDATARPSSASRSPTEEFAQAADALTRAAASLVRDRERVNSSASATGFAEMLREMQQLAKQQGALNGQAAGLFPMPNGQAGSGERGRALAKEQRAVARRLDELGDADGSGRAEALAAEARRVAEALERGDLSEATKARQEQLLKRMLDAGRSLEGEEKDEGKREARSASGVELFTPPAGDVKGAPGQRWREPTWEELRGLSAEERRAVIDYFRRMNGATTP